TEVAAETGEAVQKERSSPSIATQVLPKTDQGSLQPYIMPLLIPLKEQLVGASSPSAKPLIRQRFRLRLSIIALACLIPLIIIALPSGLLIWLTQQSHHSSGSGTRPVGTQQQINAETTATAVAQAQLQAALAAQARVQATAGITSSIGAGNVIYADSMIAPGNGWVDDGSQCFFTPQGYHVHTPSAHEVAWCYSSIQSFSNVVIIAQAQLLHGDACGLLFRLSPTSRQFYVLEINSQGEFRFVRASGNNPLN